MPRHFERMRTIAERHGGNVEKSSGDAVMVPWNFLPARRRALDAVVRAQVSATSR